MRSVVMHISESTLSHNLISLICAAAPFIVGMNPSAANFKPNNAFICVAHIVIARKWNK